MSDRGRTRPNILWTAVVFATVLASTATPGPAAENAPGEGLGLEVRQVPLDPDRPGRTRLGALDYLGGLELRGPRPSFGGLSGLLVDADGRHMVAVADTGDWFDADLDYDGGGRLRGLRNLRRGRLTGIDGRPLRHGKSLSDSESLARLADGSIVVAFERRHRLWRYPPTDPPFAARPVRLVDPPGLSRAPKNGGIEALTALGDGTLLALSEKFMRGRDTVRGWLGGPSGWRPVLYPVAESFRPTGATTLPSGEIIVLERRYNPIEGPAARLVRVPPPRVGKDAIRLTGREIARIALPLTVDNFEGIAAWTTGNGERRVLILSDDNLSGFQRTLLMLFALDD